MLIVTIILSVLLIITSALVINNRRQIQNICRRLRFKNNHETNISLNIVGGDKEWNELVNLINQSFTKQERIINEYKNGDNKLKEAIANISHDIRTPLTSIDGYFQLLKDCDNEADKERYYQIISSRITLLKEMLEELFTYSKLQDVSFQLDMETVNISKAFLDTVFEFYEDFKLRSIEPSIDIPDEEIFVTANTGAVKRVIQNLIKNAISHGEQGVNITLKKENNKAVLSIANKYSAEDDIDETRIFDRFYKADASRTKTSTGLGLSIAKQLTEKMNGNILANKTDDMFAITIELKISI